jgi:N-acetylmuramoyl-L-alanine amidase CwlA
LEDTVFIQGKDDVVDTKIQPHIVGKRLSLNEFRVYLATYDFGSIPPDRVVLHHTWRPTAEQWRGKLSVESMRVFYGAKGWTAGPHLFVAPDGVWLFTPMCDVGIHAGLGNANREFLASGYRNFKKLYWYSIGIEMVGNYEAVRPSGLIWEQTKSIITGLLQRFGKTPEQALFFHRDYTNQKSCPGKAVTKPWVLSEVLRQIDIEKKQVL